MASPFHAVTTLSSRSGAADRLRRPALLSQLGPLPRIRRVGEQLERGGTVLERSVRSDVEELSRRGAVVAAEELAELGGRPDVSEAFDAVGVRVQRRGEAAVGRGETGEQEVGDLADDALGQGMAGEPPPVRVRTQQKRVVVQHLLEVRHHPLPVDAVPGEPSTQLVVDPAARHRHQSALGDLQGGGVSGPFVVAE
jgi:hypothetical protein